MTLETALTPTLEETLNLVLSSLANFFGTTTAKIMANVPEWLAKYGWYTTLHNDLGWALILGLMLGICLAGLFVFVWETSESREATKNIWVIAFSIILVTIVICGVITILPCIFAPEIVGLEAAIKLIS